MVGQELRTGFSPSGGEAWRELFGSIELYGKPSMTEVRSGWGQSVPGHTDFEQIFLSSIREFEIAAPFIIPGHSLEQTVEEYSEPDGPEGGATIPPRANRRIELQWVGAHPHVLKEFRNTWVVVDRDRIVSSDIDPGEAVEKARKQGIMRPFLLFVQAQDDAVIF